MFQWYERVRVRKLRPQHKQFSTAARNQADDMDYFIILLQEYTGKGWRLKRKPQKE